MDSGSTGLIYSTYLVLFVEFYYDSLAEEPEKLNNSSLETQDSKRDIIVSSFDFYSICCKEDSKRVIWDSSYLSIYY